MRALGLHCRVIWLPCGVLIAPERERGTFLQIFLQTNSGNAMECLQACRRKGRENLGSSSLPDATHVQPLGDGICCLCRLWRRPKTSLIRDIRQGLVQPMVKGIGQCLRRVGELLQEWQNMWRRLTPEAYKSCLRTLRSS